MTDELVGNWIGDLRGTDIGSVFAIIKVEQGVHVVNVKLNIAGQLTELVGNLERKPTSAELELVVADAAKSPEGFAPSAKVVFETVSSDRLIGTWAASNGHAGVVGLTKYSTAQTASVPPSAEAAVQPSADTAVQPPVELVAREGQLSNVVLFRNELEVIVAKMKELVGGKNDVVVAATVDGRQIRQFSKDFFARTDLPLYVTNVNLTVNDGRQPLTSVIIVNLTDKFHSTFFVQSDNALWVGGAFAEMDDLFRRYTNPLLTVIHKHGLNANGVTLLAVIALLPDLPMLSRIALLVSSLIFANVVVFLHRRFTTTRIHLDSAVSRGFLSKVWPSLTSALSAAAILGFVAWAYNSATLTNLQRFLGLH